MINYINWNHGLIELAKTKPITTRFSVRYQCVLRHPEGKTRLKVKGEGINVTDETAFYELEGSEKDASERDEI